MEFLRRTNPLMYLPLSVQMFLRRRAGEITGAGLITLAVFCTFALASWSTSDPSFNNATADTPSNWMGASGAAFADLMFQTLGLSAFFAIAPLAIFGWYMLTHYEQDRPRLRLAAWAGAVLSAALFFSLLPLPGVWPLITGLGGLIGDGMAHGLLAVTAPLLGASPATLFFAAIAGPVALLLLGFALSFEVEFVAGLYDHLLDWLDDRAEARAYHRARHPDIEPGRLRILFYDLADWFSSLNLRRTAPVSEEERDAIRTRLQRTTSHPFAEPEEELERREGRAIPVSRSNRRAKSSKRAAREAQPSLDFNLGSDYELPPLSLLTRPKSEPGMQYLSDDALQQNARLLESVLDDFGIRGNIINVRPGPVVTLYELEPAPGIKSSRVIALADDIARSMSAVSARVAVVSGRNAIGIELPNVRRETVYLRENLSSSEYENTSSKLALALGKNIGGEPVIADLARMPHLLIAGTTGSGKSVGINTMILSILYRLPPDRCRLIMIDPKMLELSVYDGIPHLLAPVVTEPKKAVVALKWVVKEMEDRYRKMSKLGVRNIEGYNARIEEAIEEDEVLVRTVQTGFDRETGQAVYEEEELAPEPMPFIVVIVDEMADLMMVAGKEIEATVQRLAQMARAAGIHMITATQRPSVDVITGTIKANFPTRISFQVTSKIDSRTILGEQGAEQLLGQGDMLYMAGGGRVSRVHGPFVSDQEVEKVVRFLKKQGVPEYLEAITAEPAEGDDDPLGLGTPTGDSLYDQAVAIVGRDKRASTSYIQRKLQIGYNRAARLIEQMEEEGIISAPNHAGKREVLIGEPGDGVRY